MSRAAPISHPSRRSAPSLLRLWHVASLDAPTVAIVWSLAFAWVAKVRLPLWVPILLALVTWSVYTLDRLLDARTALKKGALHRLRERHRFHWRHRRILLPMACVAACAAASIIFALMTPIALERNSVLAAATLAYFTRIHSPRRTAVFAHQGYAVAASVAAAIFTPELLTGLLFTAGCVLPALTLSSAALHPSFLALGCYFASLAWLNSYAINRWETAQRSTHPTPVSRRAVAAAAAGLLGAILVGSPIFLASPISLLPTDARGAVLFASGAASALLLALLDRMRTRLMPLALRAAADLALLTPVVPLLIYAVRAQ